MEQGGVLEEVLGEGKHWSPSKDEQEKRTDLVKEGNLTFLISLHKGTNNKHLINTLTLKNLNISPKASFWCQVSGVPTWFIAL